MNLRDICADALKHPNVQAFLRVIREGESSQDDVAYRTQVGGKRLDSLQWHPGEKVFVQRLGVWSTAAGAYQFLGQTWGECADALGLTDFGSASQDLAAVFLIRRRKALDDVVAGRFEEAVHKCAKEWASLPGSPYGQPTLTMEKALAVYRRWGGALAGEEPAAPASQVAPPAAPEPTQERPMATPLVFLKAALPFIIESIPKLGKLFGSGSEVSERNVRAAEMVASTVTQAVGAASLEEAVTKLKEDPAAVQAATKAIDAIWFDLTEIGGGIQEAHKRDLAYMQPGGPRFWESPAFWISLILVALPVMVLADMLFVHPDKYSENLRTQIVTATLALLTVVGAYWLGTSASSQRKTDMLAK